MLGNLVNSRKKLKSQTLEPEKHEHRILTIKKRTRLDGYYWTVGAVSSGSGNVANASAFKGIAFSLDGRFQTNLSGGASFESDQGGLTAGSSSQDAGTYQIDGYALELRFMDKHLERLSFFRSSTKNDTLGIGGRYFIHKK